MKLAGAFDGLPVNDTASYYLDARRRKKSSSFCGTKKSPTHFGGRADGELLAPWGPCRETRCRDTPCLLLTTGQTSDASRDLLGKLEGLRDLSAAAPHCILYTKFIVPVGTIFSGSN